MDNTLSNKDTSKYIKSIPEKLINRYKDWKKTGFEEHRDWYETVAKAGQNPLAMVISCCDSRVHATSIFGADPGEFFIHRNIANLIPPYNPDGDHHGTSAAIEFAILSLAVSHIIILGHSGCGGIKNGYHLCKGDKKNTDLVFVNKWLNILKPAYDTLLVNGDDSLMIKKLEKESIKTSIKNLLDFPFIQNALQSEKLEIHGLWHNIRSGELEMLDSETMNFKSC
jgi:carbonic anhydrase